MKIILKASPIRVLNKNSNTQYHTIEISDYRQPLDSPFNQWIESVSLVEWTLVENSWIGGMFVGMKTRYRGLGL